MKKVVFRVADCKVTNDNGKCLILPALYIDKKGLQTFEEVLKAPEKQEIKDLCQLSLCSGEGLKCNKKGDAFECKCSKEDGYEAISSVIPVGPFDSQVCKVLDECANHKEPCPDGKCVNFPGAKEKYICSCNDGFKNEKDNLQKCVGACENNDCGNNGECVVFHNAFRCKCKDGFTGITCGDEIKIKPITGESKDDKLSKAESNVIIIGVVLGAILLLTIIVSAVIVRKLRSKLNKANGSNQPMDDLNPGRRGYDNPAGPR